SLERKVYRLTQNHGAFEMKHGVISILLDQKGKPQIRMRQCAIRRNFKEATCRAYSLVKHAALVTKLNIPHGHWARRLQARGRSSRSPRCLGFQRHDPIVCQIDEE